MKNEWIYITKFSTAVETDEPVFIRVIDSSGGLKEAAFAGLVKQVGEEAAKKYTKYAIIGVEKP